MSEEINNQNIDNEKSNNVSIDDLKMELANKDKEIGSMRSKLDELLNETKKAKEKARMEAEERERVKMEKAKANGDFEQQLAHSEKLRKELEEKYNGVINERNRESVKNTSMKLASELADGVNAELLSTFISDRIKPTEDGLKVLDKDGQLTVSTLDDLKREFESSDRYKSLLRGNKSSGGGAAGSGGSVSGVKEMTKAEFEKKSPSERMAFVKEGGKIINE